MARDKLNNDNNRNKNVLKPLKVMKL